MVVSDSKDRYSWEDWNAWVSPDGVASENKEVFNGWLDWGNCSVLDWADTEGVFEYDWGDCENWDSWVCKGGVCDIWVVTTIGNVVVVVDVWTYWNIFDDVSWLPVVNSIVDGDGWFIWYVDVDVGCGKVSSGIESNE